MSKKKDKNKKTIAEMEMLLNERQKDLQNWSDDLSEKDEVLKKFDSNLTQWHEELQNWSDDLSEKDEVLKKFDSNLTQWHEELQNWSDDLSKREQELEVVANKLNNYKKVLIVLFAIALLLTICSFFHNLKSTLSTDNSMDSSISADNNDLESEYYNLLCSIYNIDGRSCFDKNGNTFFLDLDCTKGNEISNPEFASYHDEWMEDSNGDRVSVYWLKDGRLAYIPSNKNVDIETDYSTIP